MSLGFPPGADGRSPAGGPDTSFDGPGTGQHRRRDRGRGPDGVMGSGRDDVAANPQARHPVAGPAARLRHLPRRVADGRPRPLPAAQLRFPTRSLGRLRRHARRHLRGDRAAPGGDPDRPGPRHRRARGRSGLRLVAGHHPGLHPGALRLLRVRPTAVVAPAPADQPRPHRGGRAARRGARDALVLARCRTGRPGGAGGCPAGGQRHQRPAVPRPGRGRTSPGRADGPAGRTRPPAGGGGGAEPDGP